MDTKKKITTACVTIGAVVAIAIITTTTPSRDSMSISDVLLLDKAALIDLGKGDVYLRAWLHRATPRIVELAIEQQVSDLDAIKRLRQFQEKATVNIDLTRNDSIDEKVAMIKKGELGYSQVNDSGGCILINPVLLVPKDTLQWIGVIGTGGPIDVVVIFRTNAMYQVSDVIEYCENVQSWMSDELNISSLNGIELLDEHIDENGVTLQREIDGIFNDGPFLPRD